MKLRTGKQNRSGEGCHLVQILILAMALTLTAPSVLGAEGINGEPEPAPVCSGSDLLTVEEGARATYPLLEPSIPGWWRQELKLQTPELRDPSTLSILPPSPAPAEASTEGRWVPGYRPATPRAQAELEAWMEGRISAMSGLEGAEAPSTPSSNYGANLLRGERVEHVAEEEITRTVRAETYEVSTIHVSDLRETEDERPLFKGPASDIHHGSGMTWNEYLLAKELAQTSPTTPEAQEATSRSQRAPGAEGIGFDAIVSNFTSVPPDPIMAAGPSHLVAIVNNRYQVWDKAGNPLTTDITMNTFFDGVDNCSGVFDVFVDYDEAGDRFVMGGMSVFQAVGVDSYLCIAATATGDPTGAWHRVGFRADASAPETWIDFPHTGIGLDAIYITGNMFGDSSGFNHIRVFAVDKDALYGGAPITVADSNLGSLFFTAQPVKLHGYTSGGWPDPGTPHHFIAHDSGGNSRIWRWSDPFNTDPVIYGTIVEEHFGGIPPNAPELGGSGSNLNDSGSAKWLDAEYRGGRLWATRNVSCDFEGGASESCIDWVQIDVSGPAPVLEQQQTGGGYGSSGDFRYYPDLSVDRNNNIAIGYTKSASTTYTEVWVTGREFGDAAGTLQPEVLQRAGLGMYTDGAGCQGGCDRWGDYTGLTVDPDGCTFWYLGQYSDGGSWNWGTHIANFRFSSCSVDSSLQVDRGTVTCDDSLAITVTDTTPIDATTVSAQTTASSSGGDTETIPAGSWVGSDCVGNDCGTWTTTLAISGDPGSNDDGTLNVTDGDTISAAYVDPHPSHDDQTRNVAVTCRTRLDDGGYIIDGGCEAAQGTELYRDYMDGGEYIAYTFGIFNPQTAPPLTDVAATLTISGPAADKVMIFNPSIYIGSLDSGTLTAPVFQLYIDPSIDAGGFRMSEHDFELSVSSAADGFTVQQVLIQSHLLQADDNIVEESQCWNFESGDQGFVRDIYDYSYLCGAADGCSPSRTIYTDQAPWTHGGGCGSETRDDYPEMTCDTAGTSAFMSNADGGVCNDFTQTDNTITDDILYSPIFSPAHTGSAANGQPWYFNWSYAEWFYRSQMVSGLDPAMVVGFFWDDDYPGVATPAYNEVDTHYSYFRGFIYSAMSSTTTAVP